MNCKDLFMGKGRYLRIPPKILLVMKLTTFLLLITILTVSAKTSAQKITLNEKHAQLIDILDKISQQSGYNIVGDVQLLKTQPDVNVNLKDANIQQALDQTLDGLNLTYQLADKTILIKQKPQPTLLDNVKAYLTSIDVTGTVVDENGQPLNQATIKTKDGKQVTTTDVKGYFTLKNVDPNTTIIVNYIGYDDQELKAVANFGAIRMKVSTNPLNEVKVIAYGITNERLSVGDVSSVDDKQISSQPVNNPLLTLQGAIPGIVITPSSIAPGASIDVKIEGLNSLTSGYTPLFIIDGVPYNGGMPSTGTLAGSILGNANGNPLNYISSDDIASISVLKDADATAIYGARAANGAVLITTKKGKVGSTKVDLNLRDGFGQVPHFMPVMNTTQYLQMRHEAFSNDKVTAIPGNNYDLTLWDTTRSTNWQKVLLGGKAHYQDYNAEVSGGSTTTQFLIGATHHSDGTVWNKNNNEEQTNLHFNFTAASPNQKFHIMLTGNYGLSNEKLPNADPESNIMMAPDAPSLYRPDGSINWSPNASGGSTFANPAVDFLEIYQAKVNNLVSNLTASYQFNKEFDLKISAGYTNMQQDETSIIPYTAIPPDYVQYYGSYNSAQYQYSNANGWNIEPQIHYQNTWGKNKIDALAGATAMENNGFSTGFNGTNYASDAQLLDPSAAASLLTAGTSEYTYKYVGLFSRINYNYDDRYILELTGNRDGSSRFGSNNEFANFWSIAGGWLFSNEIFVKNNVPWLSNGKIRISYGLTGNDQIGNYNFLSLYYSTVPGVPYQGNGGFITSGLPNPNLQWEDDRKLNLGVDLGFFKNRILAGLDYYRNRSSNLLIPYTLPIQTGFNNIVQNFPATIQNSGLEFTLNTTNVKSKNFSWTSSANLTIPRNKLLAFPRLAQSSYASTLKIGEAFTGLLPVYHYAGVNPQTGLYQFYAHDGSLTSTPNYSTDRIDTINTSPKFYGGLTNIFRYREFELSFLLNFTKVVGPNLFFGNRLPGYYFRGNGYNQPAWLANGVWQKPGDIAVYQRYNQNYSAGTAFGDANLSNAAYGDDSYLRLQNLQFSWTSPSNWSKRLDLTTLRLFIQAQNLLTFTGYRGIDPSIPGLYNYSTLRIFSFGIYAEFN